MLFEFLIPVFGVGFIVIVMFLAVWMMLRETELFKRRFIRGKWINDSLGNIYKNNLSGYVFFSNNWSDTEYFKAISHIMVHSSQIAATANAINKMGVGDTIWPSNDVRCLHYSIMKWEDFMFIGCQKLTYKQANEIVRYLRNKGVDIDYVLQPVP